MNHAKSNSESVLRPRSAELLTHHTLQMQAWLDLLHAGDEVARGRLIEVAAGRLRIMAHDMLAGDRLRLWEETDDVLQDALLLLHKSLANIRPKTVREFLHIAAFQIRRAILNMARRHFGPHGTAAHRASAGDHFNSAVRSQNGHWADDSTPSKLASRSEQWLRVQQAVSELPDELREVTELVWFHGLAQVEVARLLCVTDRTVRRRWQQARLRLADALADESTPVALHQGNGHDVE